MICTNATISADNFNVSVGSSFSINSGNITIADNFTTVVGEDFYSRGIIAADNFFVSTENNLDIDEDITANSIDFQVGKDFFFRQFRDNFVWNENDNLVVEGSAFILTIDFTNNGAISIANEFDIVVDNFNNNANINADIPRLPSSMITVLLIKSPSFKIKFRLLALIFPAFTKSSA